MKKKVLSFVLAATMVMGLAACGGSSTSATGSAADSAAVSVAEETASAVEETASAVEETASVAEETTSSVEETASKAEEAAPVVEDGTKNYPEGDNHLKTGDKPETDTIVWAQGNSGNVLVSIAKQQGYFDEVGLTVNEVPLDENQLQAVVTGQVDIASNSGTWTPIKMIAAGDDMSIIGGHMLTGCMPIIAKEGAEWKGPESLLGKKVADTISRYSVLHELVDQGHDLEKEIQFFEMNDEDEIQAILKGEIDYAIMGTGRMYTTLNTEGIQIVAYCSDITPNYSCCRMVARDSWVRENPTTVKLLNEALIRAQEYFEDHREETVDLMVEQLGATKEYVEAYLLNEHYRINPDTLKNTVFDNYYYMKKVNGLENENASVKLEDHIYNDLYKQALDEAQEKWGSEDPEFYEKAQQFYKDLNTNE